MQTLLCNKNHIKKIYLPSITMAYVALITNIRTIVAVFDAVPKQLLR